MFDFIIATLIIYLFVSAIVIICSLYEGRDISKTPIFGSMEFSLFFSVGAFIALILFVQPGFERSLFFLSDSWGGEDEDGDWTPYKSYLSYLMAIHFSSYIFYKVGQIKQKIDDLIKEKESLLAEIKWRDKEQERKRTEKMLNYEKWKSANS